MDPSDGVAALERRALQLENRIAEGARRLLMVGENLIIEVNAALAELKDELLRVLSAIEAKRRTATLAADGEELVRLTIDGFQSMASVLGDPTFPLERRREVLRRLLPSRDGVRPIRVDIDVTAPRGWRRALKRVTVRCLTSRREAKYERSVGSVVAGAVAAEAGQPGAEWDPGEGRATWERDMGAEDMEAVPDLVRVIRRSVASEDARIRCDLCPQFRLEGRRRAARGLAARERHSIDMSTILRRRHHG